MNQMSFLQSTAWSVGDITQYIKDLLESDHNLADIWVQGEISNFSRPRSGHLYFTIKDSKAALRCVMWRSAASRLSFAPKDGDAVEVHGAVSLYEVGGQYQLYVDQIRPLGAGALYQKFLALKTQLEMEGLFDDDRKRPIPYQPRRIGLVTSPTGAALRDMLNTLKRRYPLVEVILAPSAVQGVEAPAGIVNGLQALNRLAPRPDVILVARGGGSIEDLWAFNDENVARAIAASAVPVISGVGHQTDFTIADFVADVRAPTPTAAAELAVPDQADFRLAIAEKSQALQRAVLAQIQEKTWALRALSRQFQHQSPQNQIQTDRQRLDEYTIRLNHATQYQLKIQRSQLAGLREKLTALNPTSILGRGYALVSTPNGEIIRMIKQAQPDEIIRVQVSDGAFRAAIISNAKDQEGTHE